MVKYSFENSKVLESGSSDDPCAEIYQGKSAFSEPETRFACYCLIII